MFLHRFHSKRFFLIRKGGTPLTRQEQLVEQADTPFSGIFLAILLNEQHAAEYRHWRRRKMVAYAIRLDTAGGNQELPSSCRSKKGKSALVRFSAALLVALAITFLWVATANATTKTSTGTGNWSYNSRWSPYGVPGAGDSVVIASGHTVTLNTNATCGALTVLGTLSYSNTNNRTLTVTTSSGVSGNVRIS